ncbi:MAG: MurR/RpiR family transcriptional regulator [Lachnospiraceae bacterium]|nr:MurR/RpiR family transcriptional regulator [Lachnospiraceae bacterium]
MSDLLGQSVLETIKKNYHNVFPAERKVLDVVVKQPQKVVNMNVSELAQESGVSDATVVRTCNHIGYKGYYHFRIALASDVGRKMVPDTQENKGEDDALKLFKSYSESMIAIGKAIDLQALKKSAELLIQCRQVHIIAVGNTSHLAQYMGFRLGRQGVRSTFNAGADFFMNQINLADNEDIIVAISQSGSSKDIVKGMELGSEKGLLSIAITDYLYSPVGKLADYVLVSGDGLGGFAPYYYDYAHLRETAVIDALLCFVMNKERINEKNAYKPEILMADTKL